MHIISKSISDGLLKAIEVNDYTEAKKILKLGVFFLSKILKQEEQKPHLGPFLTMLLESSVRTKWSDYEFSKVALRLTIDLMDKYK